ncbi:MFS transporter [Pseudooceanicola sp. 200-1SW]|uniref:MFS transporter n=1 Tax=Pseudooceanicola sp. 200-1SW TaxID=3425949 RepID=UPI003D7F6368
MAGRVTIRTPWRGAAAIFLLNGMVMGTWAGRIPAIAARFDLDEAGVGLLLLVLGVGAILAFPAAGRLTDRRGALPVMRISMLGLLVSVAAAGLAPSLALLCIAVFCMGALHGTTDVTMNAWASEVERQIERPAMTAFHGMWSLGAGAGALSGYAAAESGIGPGLHFTVVPVLGAALLLPLTLIPWQSDLRERAADAPVFAVPRGVMLLVGLVALTAGLGEGAVTDWSALYLIDRAGLSEGRATLGYAAFSVTMVAGRLMAGQVIRAFGNVAVARAGALLGAAGMALVVWAPLPGIALAGFAAIGLGLAPIIPLVFSRAATDPEISPGQGIASVATLGYGAMLLGPPLLGAVADLASLRLAFVLVGLGLLVSAALAPVLRVPGARHAPVTRRG